jgi:hypothetical protein
VYPERVGSSARGRPGESKDPYKLRWAVALGISVAPRGDFAAAIWLIAVLRLRGRFAMRNTHSAQDDRMHLNRCSSRGYRCGKLWHLLPQPIRLGGPRDSVRTVPVPRGSRTAVRFTGSEKSDDIEAYALDMTMVELPLRIPLYKTQVPVVEQAIETAALMLGTDKSRGYCLMICADFLAGANLVQRVPNDAPAIHVYGSSNFFLVNNGRRSCTR